MTQRLTGISAWFSYICFSWRLSSDEGWSQRPGMPLRGIWVINSICKFSFPSVLHYQKCIAKVWGSGIFQHSTLDCGGPGWHTQTRTLRRVFARRKVKKRASMIPGVFGDFQHLNEAGYQKHTR